MKQKRTRTQAFTFSTVFSLLLTLPGAGLAQISDNTPRTNDLPSAPQPQVTSASAAIVGLPGIRTSPLANLASQASGSQASGGSNSRAVQPLPPAGAMRLTRIQAEQLAIKNNPRISWPSTRFIARLAPRNCPPSTETSRPPMPTKAAASERERSRRRAYLFTPEPALL